MGNDNMLIIGGDKRFCYVKDFLLSKCFSVSSYDGDEAELFAIMGNKPVTVILPLPVSRDAENINMAGVYPPLKADTVISRLEKGDTVFGGLIGKELCDKLEKKGVRVFDYYDEGMICENATLTAQALMNVFCENNIDIRRSRTLVTGFGRTAKATARQLNAEKCDFCICARSSIAENEASTLGYDFIKLDSLKNKIGEFDVIVNTVPALILDKSILAEMSDDAVITDIASAPFGEDEAAAELYGIKVIRALSLPGKYTPVQAGVLIGERIISICSGR